MLDFFTKKLQTTPQMNIWFFILVVFSLNLSTSCYRSNELKDRREIVSELSKKIKTLHMLNDLYKINEVEFEKRLLALIHSVSVLNCCCINNCEYNSLVTGIVKEQGKYLNKVFY